MAAKVCALFLFVLVAAQGCASQNVRLIHPQSGATVTCGEMGVGTLALAVGGLIEECVKRYGREGYVPLDKLAPGERADLERRGLLPKEERVISDY